MAKRITDRERLLTYSHTALKDELEDAIEIFRTALRARFGADKKKGGRSGRKQGAGNRDGATGLTTPEGVPRDGTLG